MQAEEKANKDQKEEKPKDNGGGTQPIPIPKQ